MADQTKLRKRLEALLKLPGNQICADCKKRGDRGFLIYNQEMNNLTFYFCVLSSQLILFCF